MDTEPGRSLILWTVRLSVACYAAALWLRLFGGPLRGHRLSAQLWQASWMLCVIHVVFAFHFEHHWSFAAALTHTAEMTERVVGWHWGGGLYINFVFLTLWGLHAFFRDRVPGDSHRAQTIAMHAVAAFMMFNATVVFGPSWWMIPAAVFCAMLVGAAWHRKRIVRSA